jgi:sigma-E factor negative regulatory protein RseA
MNSADSNEKNGILSLSGFFWGREMGQAQQHSVPSTAAERISALMDGQVLTHEFNAALDAAKSEAGRADWHTYQLIGDALRSDELVQAGSNDAFLKSFGARFAEEPHLLAPVAVQQASRHRMLLRPSWVRRVVPATAVAAAVAAVTWVAVPQFGETLNPDGVTTVAMAPVATEAPVRPSVVAVSADTPMIRDARLDDYLRAHRQAATTGVALPYMRAAVAQPVQAQDSAKE